MVEALVEALDEEWEERSAPVLAGCFLAAP
jgi:hypothetical protein